MSDAIEKDKKTEAPGFKLYAVNSVVWAAFWGSFVAAGIVMAINFARLGRKTAALATALLSIVATTALIAGAFVLPDDLEVPNSYFYIPQLVAAYLLAKAVQGPAIQKHIEQGGALSSAWYGSLIGALCLPCIFGPVVGVALLMEPSFGERIGFGGSDEIYYSGEATEADARKLGQILTDQEYFGQGGASVKLEKSSARYRIGFVVVAEARGDPETAEQFRSLGAVIVAGGFPTPLAIDLCDDSFGVVTSLVIGP